MKLIFLLEERSMKEVLSIIVPKILPAHYQAVFIDHQGKTDLHNSIRRKLRSWREPDSHFVIVHDKDSSDCVALKQQLLAEAVAAGRPDTLIRIACTELESWFLGDLRAIELAFELQKPINANKRKFRNPDALSNAKEELKKIVPTYQQIAGSAAIARHMDICNNNSFSFRIFLDGLRRIVREHETV